jgi:hypothetical protein
LIGGFKKIYKRKTREDKIKGKGDNRYIYDVDYGYGE